MSKTTTMTFNVKITKKKRRELEIIVTPAGYEAPMKTEIEIDGKLLSRKEVLELLTYLNRPSNFIEIQKWFHGGAEVNCGKVE